MVSTKTKLLKAKQLLYVKLALWITEVGPQWRQSFPTPCVDTAWGSHLHLTLRSTATFLRPHITLVLGYTGEVSPQVKLTMKAGAPRLGGELPAPLPPRGSTAHLGYWGLHYGFFHFCFECGRRELVHPTGKKTHDEGWC